MRCDRSYLSINSKLKSAFQTVRFGGCFLFVYFYLFICMAGSKEQRNRRFLFPQTPIVRLFECFYFTLGNQPTSGSSSEARDKYIFAWFSIDSLKFISFNSARFTSTVNHLSLNTDDDSVLCLVIVGKYKNSINLMPTSPGSNDNFFRIYAIALSIRFDRGFARTSRYLTRLSG